VSDVRAKPWQELEEAARRAIQVLCERRSEFVAPGMSSEALAAARIAGIAIDLLSGDPDRAPNALDQVRRMQRALERTALDTLEYEVATAAEQQRTATKELTRKLLLQRFVQRIGSHLEALGVSRQRLTAEQCGPVLARWRAAPVSRRRELSSRGVVIELLVLAGDDRDSAKQRVLRRAKRKTD
jgi:hypothetical protein